MHVLGNASFITCPVDGGRSLHLYDINLHLKGVSRPLPSEWTSEIGHGCGAETYSCLAAHKSFTFGAIGSSIAVLDKMRPAAKWSLHEEPVSFLLTVANFLVSVSSADRRVVVWKLPARQKAGISKTGDVLVDVFLPPDYHVTALTHPPTYLNKILFGSSDGRLLLLNLRSRKVVHVFRSFDSAITALSSAPILDVVAVGTSDGRVILQNLRFDETLFTFSHGTDLLKAVVSEEELDNPTSDLESPPARPSINRSDSNGLRRSLSVCHISFCTDGSETLVSGDSEGNLAIWSLNDKRLLVLARTVHEGGTSFVHFLPAEPILVTAGVCDNSLKVHVFEGPLRTPRVLRSRDGHRLPPTKVRFSGRDSKMLVSAGLDRELRVVSAVRDSQNRSFSQAHLEKSSSRVKKRKRGNAGVEIGAKLQISGLASRLPAVTQIATSTARRRDKDFANVVTLHEKRPEAYTWRSDSGALYKHILRPPPPSKPLKLAHRRVESVKVQKTAKETTRPETKTVVRRRARNEATAVVLSQCGNFAVIGSANGSVHVYNLQSGRHLGSLSMLNPKDNFAGNKNTFGWGRAHVGPVGGLAVDACDELIVSGGNVDNLLRFWNLRARHPAGTPVTLPSGVTSISWSRASNLIAVVGDDFGIYIYDGSTRKLARRLVEHEGAVTDICFDGAGRRLISSSIDGTVRTWDLPSGRAIDVLRCESAPTSVTISPGGEFIATCHVNNLSIALWVDLSKFGHSQVMESRKKNSLTYAGCEDEKPRSAAEFDLVSLPGAAGREQDVYEGNETGEVGQNTESSTNPIEMQTEALAPELVTLSGRPTTQWSTLANLDAIKRRNKPLKPPKKPEQVPFFIPTKQGLKPVFDLSVHESSLNDNVGFEDNAVIPAGTKSDGKSDSFFENSEFGILVVMGKFQEAHKFMSALGPSSVDVQLRALHSSDCRLKALEYFKDRLNSRTDFELNQAHLDVFLRAHGRDIIKDPNAKRVLQELRNAQNEAFRAVEASFQSVLTLAAHFAGQL